MWGSREIEALLLLVRFFIKVVELQFVGDQKNKRIGCALLQDI